jgi:hypothetical protein
MRTSRSLTRRDRGKPGETLRPDSISIVARIGGARGYRARGDSLHFASRRVSKDIQLNTADDREVAALPNYVRGFALPQDAEHQADSEQEIIIVELFKTLQLPTDDLHVIAREFINTVFSRAGLHRCLRRHRVSDLDDLVSAWHGEKPATKKTFKDYEPGFPQYRCQVPAANTGRDIAALPVRRCGSRNVLGLHGNPCRRV